MMKKRLHGILKYAKKFKRFQSGGVTFSATPAMYNPEEDFYMKSAYGRYTAGQKQSGKTPNTKQHKVTANFLKDGPEGTRNFYNNMIQAEMDNINSKLAADPSWYDTYEGRSTISRFDRMSAESAAGLSSITDSRKKAFGNLTDNDLSTDAYFKGGYAVRDKDGKLSHVSPVDYYANEGDYTKLSVREAFTAYDKMPLNADSPFKYSDLGGLKAGNKFFNEDILGMRKDYKAMYNGNPMTSQQLEATYDSILNTGAYDTIGKNANLANNISSLTETINSTPSASNALDSRIWSNPELRKSILDEKEGDDRKNAYARARHSEIFKLAYIQGKPKSGDDVDNDTGGSGKKMKLGLHYQDTFGINSEYNETLDITDYSTHIAPGDTEMLQIYGAKSVPTLEKYIQDTNNAAVASGGKKSANLLQLTDLKKVVKLNDGQSLSGKSIHDALGMTSSEFQEKGVMSNVSNLKTIVRPAMMKNKKPLPGFGAFSKAYAELYKKNPFVSPENAQGGTGAAINKTTAELRNLHRIAIYKKLIAQGGEAGAVAEWFRDHKGLVPTQQQVVGTVRIQADKSKFEGDAAKMATQVTDDERDKYFKLNPGVASEGIWNSTKEIFTGGDTEVYDVMVFFPTQDFSVAAMATNQSITPGDFNNQKASYDKFMQLPLDTILSQLEN